MNLALATFAVEIMISFLAKVHGQSVLPRTWSWAASAPSAHRDVCLSACRRRNARLTDGRVKPYRETSVVGLSTMRGNGTVSGRTRESGSPQGDRVWRDS